MSPELKLEGTTMQFVRTPEKQDLTEISDVQLAEVSGGYGSQCAELNPPSTMDAFEPDSVAVAELWLETRIEYLL